ncbi:uncharacterized protein TNCT_333131 [Trichonephila clavata]|uniref:Reverse transcriptase domain-containing protein n=1 Tax=Trichonephila clavata TaxID=2740835 RepID=A0A8X6GN96_TRICU|nr:uncharacterized protein TNCT_333131 [Trichonephila clavata]
MYKQTYPIATKHIENNIYMDDFVLGTSTDTEAITLYREMLQLTSRISLPLAKWTTNSKTLQGVWKQENVPFREITQVLGVKWDTDKDVFQIDVQAKIVEASKEPVTKRLLLKLMSKFYDPLGLFAPVTVIVKILFQDTWLSGIKWDELLRLAVAQQWHKWINELQSLKDIRIQDGLGFLKLPMSPSMCFAMLLNVHMVLVCTDNPADHLTRGTFPSQLPSLESWWHGPKWLNHDSDAWPTKDFPSHSQPSVEVESRKTESRSFYVATTEPIIDISHYSSYTKLLRVTAWILCFVHNCKSHLRIIHELNCNEIEKVKGYWIQIMQRQCFSAEINALKKGHPLQKISKISCFNPFFKDDYLRLGGRL